MIQFLPIFIALVISVTAFSLALYLLDLIWLKPGHCQIPLENPQLESNPSIRSSLRGNEDKQVKSLSEMLKIYMPLIRSLDSKYWIQHIGLDGYTYLYFQRKLFILLSIVGGVVAIVVPTFNIIFSKTRQPEDLSDPTVRLNVYNDYYQLRSLVDCLLLYLFSIGAIFTVFRIKWHIKNQLIAIKNDKSAQEELPKLKSRSVHVRGMFPEDRKGDYLKSEIRRIIDTMDGNGRIVATIVVPDFTKMIELENARKRIDNAQKLYDAKEPAVRRLCFPEKFRQPDYYEKRRRAIDENIDKEIMKPVVCSGHAFMCFDSVRTRDYVLQYYKPDAKNTFEAFRHNLPINRKSLLKRKVTSTFQKFNDEVMLKELEDRQLNILMDPLESPFDIFWANLGGTREFFKLIFGIVAFFFLIFLSTPESMLTFLQKLPGMGFLNASQYISDKDELGSIMRQIVKAFWIMLFNQIFIQIMTFSAYFEKHRSFTLLQLSIFSKALFYLLLNTLVVPTFTLVSGYSLFQMILHRGSYLFEVVKMFYFIDTGRFFIIVLLQSGAFSALSSLIRTGEILNSFGSSWLAYYSRNYLNDLEKWRKKEADVFSYGFNSAQFVIAFTIVVTYAIPVPGIIFAGISFFAMRHFVDGFNLLTVFKKEIDSGGNMIGNILKYVLFACLLPQVALSISFGYNGYIVPCVLSGVIGVVTLVSIYRISSPVYVEDDDPGLKEEGSQNLREDINRWEAAYRHPLLVTPSEITVQRGERMISFRLPTEQTPMMNV